MGDTEYQRPKIERARLVNPERRSDALTDAEQEVMQIAKQRRRQLANRFSLAYRQYDAPFYYSNFRVELGRPWENTTNFSQPDMPEEKWGKRTDETKAGYVGAEFNPDGVELDVPPYGAITLEIHNVRLLLSERPMIGPEPTLYRKVEIEPFRAKVVIMKIGVGFKVTYGHVTRAVIRADCSEAASYNFCRYNFSNNKGPLYPIDRDFEWSPSPLK